MFEVEKFSTAIVNIQKRALSIPFGNSLQQIDFLVADSHTPERAYRTLLLNFEQRFNDLKMGSIERRKNKNKIKQLERKIEVENDPLLREALALEIEEITVLFPYEDKLAADCVAELKYMQSMIEKLPEYSREEFEAKELDYFTKKTSGKQNLELSKLIKEGKVKCLNS